jgi:hypothetical protein
VESGKSQLLPFHLTRRVPRGELSDTDEHTTPAAHNAGRDRRFSAHAPFLSRHLSAAHRSSAPARPRRTARCMRRA